MGGDRGAQLLCALHGDIGRLIGTDRYLNTSGFDLLFWTILMWLTVRILRTRNEQLWVLVGSVAGIGLLNSDLVAILMAGIVLGVAAFGPRQMLRSPWIWVGGVIAVLIWSPYLLWQGQHGWPEFAVSRAIAAGSSATSTPRILLIPEQFLLVSPYFSPVWIVGLVRMLRRGSLEWCRAIGTAYIIVAVIFLITGGKSYYLASVLPVFLAAGAQPVVEWARRGAALGRHYAIVIGFVITAIGTAFFTLPVLPVTALHRTFIPSVNTDLGETVAWPTYVAEIAEVYRDIPSSERSTAAILTENYGEAGAVDHFGERYGLPSAHSGQDGFWYWGPPSTRAGSFVVVGFSASTLARDFGVCHISGAPRQHTWTSRTMNSTFRCGSAVTSGRTGSASWPKFKVLG